MLRHKWRNRPLLLIYVLYCFLGGCEGGGGGLLFLAYNPRSRQIPVGPENIEADGEATS